MTREQKQQFTLRITQANPTELVVILYEMTLGYVEDARAAQETERIAAIDRARACLDELIRSLHIEHEPALQIRKLLFFCIRRLTQASLRYSQDKLDEVTRVLTPLRDAFAQIAPLNPKGAVMRNSQTIYAGLTYGRGSLTENMADQGTNRGMRV